MRYTGHTEKICILKFETGADIRHKDEVADKSNYGFDAQKEEYVDMLKAGIIDPTKVTRSALQNASSVASLMLTTEVMITDMPEEKAEGMPGMPPGGMGGMY